jgi:two-component system, NarL family, sensor histidine kinase UhpB
LEQRTEEVRVIIEDDGVGFDGEADPGPSAKPRLGLSGIRERLSLLRGSLTLETSPVSGTTLYVRIPYPQQIA